MNTSVVQTALIERMSGDSSETHQRNQNVSAQFINVNRENHNK